MAAWGTNAWVSDDAAAHVVKLLSKNSVCHVEYLKCHMELTIRKLEQVRDVEEWEGQPDRVTAVEAEIEVLRSRLAELLVD